MQHLSESQAMRYARQVALPGMDLEGQEKLLNAHVVIVGMGGLGCSCAQMLAAAGVGHLSLVDGDTVSRSNLSRQVLFNQAHLEQPKVRAAQSLLRALNPDLRLDVYDQFANEALLVELLGQADLLVDCTDNRAVREQINRTALATNKPWVSGGAIRMEGQVMSFVPAANAPCYGCYSQLFGDTESGCAENGVLTPLVGIIGSMQALEVIKLICGLGTIHIGKIQHIDGLAGQWRELTLPKLANCKACQPVL